MTYVINGACVGVKNAGCIDVCPVDCIHPTPEETEYEAAEQLYIDPDECIDCGACIEECPVEAITTEEDVPAGMERFTEANAAYFGASK